MANIGISDTRALAAALLALTLSCAPALAAPKGIDDCEAIKDANAYNLCLASFGPTRAHKTVSYPMAHDGAARDDGGRESTAPTRGRLHRREHLLGGRVAWSRHGRVRMEFAPGRQ